MESLLFAQAAGGAGGEIWSVIITFGLIFFIFYFIVILPYKRDQKKLQNMLDGMKKNDKVVTRGGIVGVVTNMKDNFITLRVDESNNVKMDFLRSAIIQIVDKDGDKGNSKKDDSKETSDKKDDNKGKKKKKKKKKKK